MRRLTPLAISIAVAAAVLLLATAFAPAHPLRRAPGCAIFPKNNAWNQRVDRLPVDKRSATYVRTIGASANFHADFGSGTYDGGPIGIPYDVVSKATKRVHVSFDYASESDRVGYPIPKGVHIEGGAKSSGDRHALLVDRSSCKLYELYSLHHTARGWHAGSGAVWNLRSDHLRKKGFTSADAAGLPILPGLARYDDVRKGSIDHALRFTVPRTRRSFVYPARHQAGDSTDPSLPPMGLRIRLKKNVSLRGLGPQARMVATALKRYGAILADNGSPWYFSGAPDSHWSNDQLHELDRISGRDFEVVNTASLPHPGR